MPIWCGFQGAARRFGHFGHYFEAVVWSVGPLHHLTGLEFLPAIGVFIWACDIIGRGCDIISFPVLNNVTAGTRSLTGL